MQTKIFTRDEIKDLKVIAIARKYKVSDDYVRKLLLGLRERNSETARGIVQDAIHTLRKSLYHREFRLKRSVNYSDIRIGELPVSMHR
jgi:hypothetical protein